MKYKKYKIGNKIITADSISKAVKITKLVDSVNKMKDGMTHENWSFIDRFSPDFQTVSEAQELITHMRQKGLKTYYLTAEGKPEERLLENAIRNIRLAEKSARISTLTAIYTPDHDKFTKGYTIELRDSMKDGYRFGLKEGDIVTSDRMDKTKTYKLLEFVNNDSFVKLQEVGGVGYNARPQLVRLDGGIRKVKDSCIDEAGVFSKRTKMSELEALSFANRHGYNIRPVVENGVKLTLMYNHDRHIATFNHNDDVLLTDSISDADYSYLTEEEEKAIEDYRQAIQSTDNHEVLKIFQHILAEELDHVEELKQAESMDDCDMTEDSPMMKPTKSFTAYFAISPNKFANIVKRGNVEEIKYAVKRYLNDCILDTYRRNYRDQFAPEDLRKVVKQYETVAEVGKKLNIVEADELANTIVKLKRVWRV